MITSFLDIPIEENRCVSVYKDANLSIFSKLVGRGGDDHVWIL